MPLIKLHHRRSRATVEGEEDKPRGLMDMHAGSPGWWIGESFYSAMDWEPGYSGAAREAPELIISTFPDNAVFVDRERWLTVRRPERYEIHGIENEPGVIKIVRKGIYRGL